MSPLHKAGSVESRRGRADGPAWQGRRGVTKKLARLMDCLYTDAVPPEWAHVAYPSCRPLAAW